MESKFIQSKSKLASSYFVLTLHTELHWGYKNYPNSKQYRAYSQNKQKLIETYEKLLNLCEKYKIPVTWALVGKFFLEYPHFIVRILDDPLKHEIGYHSFSHENFHKIGPETAEMEIKMGINLANEFGIKFKSFVFPENNIGYLDLLNKYDFKIYGGRGLRSNMNLILRAYSYYFYEKLTSYPVTLNFENGLYELPTSMPFFDELFPYTLVYRAKSGIKKSINHKKIFHIAMHPEDLFLVPSLIKDLENLFKFIKSVSDAKKIRIITMGDLANANEI